MQTQQNPGYENVVDSWSVGIIVYRWAAALTHLMVSMLTKALPFEENADLAVDVRVIASELTEEKNQGPIHSAVRRRTSRRHRNKCKR